MIEIRASVQAEQVEVEPAGEIDLELRADPGVTDIDVERSAPAGRQSYSDLRIDVRARAWMGKVLATVPAPAPAAEPPASANEPQQGTDP